MAVAAAAFSLHSQPSPSAAEAAEASRRSRAAEAEAVQPLPAAQAACARPYAPAAAAPHALVVQAAAAAAARASLAALAHEILLRALQRPPRVVSAFVLTTTRARASHPCSRHARVHAVFISRFPAPGAALSSAAAGVRDGVWRLAHSKSGPYSRARRSRASHAPPSARDDSPTAHAIVMDIDRDVIARAKVLMIGAGGIGCELMKTLACSGFQNITAIDLDTIDVSNLNRQFLFRKRHVGMAKSIVAKESVEKFRPGVTIEAMKANVKESRFDATYFKGFDVVLNGLDNLEARRHVNRLCLAAEVPLVESGTTGYVGQVTVHARGTCACFECTEKPTPKSYPICTLRDTPDKPVHCIVYAKELLFSKLFGDTSKGSDLDEEDAVEAGAFRRNDGESAHDFAKRVFEYVFGTKIQALLLKDDMWKNRTKPTALTLAGAELEGEFSESDPSAKSARRAHGLIDPQMVWTQSQCAKVFVSATARLLNRNSVLEFDKDDDDAVEFVTAVSNLRSANYGIPPQSLFDAKGMAGNIIHAVATTNAIVSGLITLEAIKILHNKMDQTRYTFVMQHPSNGRLLQPLAKEAANPKCVVCGNARVELVCDTNTFTKRDLVDRVLKKKLSVNEPSIQFGATILHEEGEGLEEDEIEQYEALGARALTALPSGGVVHGKILSISDYSQNLDFELMVTHREEWDEEKEPEGFLLRGEEVRAKEDDVEAENADGAASAAAANDDDELVIVDDEVQLADDDAKRKRDDGDDKEDNAKAQKTTC